MAKILLADDDDALVATLTEWLQSENYLVDVVSDGDAALEHLQALDYDAIVLDWSMPITSGVEVCRQYRAAGGKLPLLILTGKDSVEDIELGLDAGADDYVTKPFVYKELSARLKALMRRSAPAPGGSNTLTVRDIALDVAVRKVTKADKQMSLQPVEFSVLEFLMKHPRQVFSPDALLQRIWGSDTDVSHHAIYSCIKRLRKKLECADERPLIVSTYGIGYQLEP